MRQARGLRAIGLMTGALSLGVGVAVGAVGARFVDPTPFSPSDMTQARAEVAPARALAEQYRQGLSDSAKELKDARAEVIRLKDESSARQSDLKRARTRIE